MKKSALFALLAGLGTGLFATVSHAQVFPPQPGLVLAEPQFWIAVIAGIILAVGLQSILMAISVATGLSMTPDIRKAASKSKIAAMTKEDRRFLFGEKEEDEEDHLKERAAASITLANSFGVWATITTSIALFLASFLAVKLGMIGLDSQGVIIGLVIWAAFFVIMAYLEWRSIRSLMGGMFHLARAGLTTGGDFLQSVLGKSPEHRAEDMGRRAVRGVYDEISHISHRDKLDKKLRKYIQSLAPSPLNYDRVHDDLVEILKEIKIEENLAVDAEDVTRVLSVKLEKDHKLMNRDNAAKLKNTVEKAVRNVQAEPDKAEKAMLLAETLAPLPDEQAHALRVRLEETLLHTGRKELDPDALHRDIENIINDPQSSLDIVRARLATMNRETVKALLAEYKDMDRAQADRLVENVLGIVEKLRHKYGAREAYGETYAEGYETGLPRRKLSARAEEKLAAYFDSLHRPELDYYEIRADIEDILHDPKIAPRILKSRLAQVDQGTLEAILESNRYISHDQAHRIAEQVMSAKNNVGEALEKVQEKAVVQYEKTRRRAVIAAEHAREAAMAAAWWIVIAAVISALAASVGGWLATTTV